MAKEEREVANPFTLRDADVGPTSRIESRRRCDVNAMMARSTAFVGGRKYEWRRHHASRIDE